MDRGLNYNPCGRINLTIPKLNMFFRSNSIDWLLIENNNAVLRGTGKINLHGNYGYLLLASNNPDKLRIIIWDKNDNDKLVFDNMSLQNVNGFISFDRSLLFAKEDFDESETVENFALEQNYPNPFNPSTSIKYAVSNQQFVLLKVYDVLGNEVATLVNEEKAPGHYEVEFNAAGLSSGIYIYRLQSGDFVQSRKMLLLK
jgi:hypothetical protein